MNWWIEPRGAAMTALLHLPTKGIKALLPITRVCGHAGHAKPVRFTRSQPSPMLRVVAVNADASPTQAELFRGEHDTIHRGKLQSSRTVFGDQKALLAIGPGPALGCKGG